MLFGISYIERERQNTNLPGAVARSDARPPGMRMVAGSILTSGKTLFRFDLVMKQFLRPFSPFR